jgi:hypothetical protein
MVIGVADLRHQKFPTEKGGYKKMTSLFSATGSHGRKKPSAVSLSPPASLPLKITFEARKKSR